MQDLILHHYANSPFSEKVRLVLGMKGIAWKSVTVPTMLPKPDVVALTGGYRRTPFMQIGADIYCDTALMCRVIDKLFPTPPLFPAEAGGAQHMVAHWADTALFWAAIPYTMQPAGAQHIFAGLPPEAIKAFAADRAAMAGSMRRSTMADAGANLRLQLGWLEQQLGDGREFICGALPSIADFATVQSVWYIERVPPVAAVLQAFPKTLQWFERMRAFGHGEKQKFTSEEAIEAARSAIGTVATSVAPDQGFAAGDAVTVTPTDYAQDAVTGRLVGLANDEVAIERRDERAGRVVVHFPRLGYQVKKAEAAQ
ncbi:glutathione S-transferase family protein [Piscinibacter terrae]|uniref:Glutathione S-transferase family protein n=1 Tax=Piscinibacter terrae TaxID=2496871 RepID=A0A3N7HNG0_9BURK|nr:glutathione S-transferase family protein [Albitalea terrae]RQP23707.1 glutathione S-transferase family protein [Albitalea terrae]